MDAVWLTEHHFDGAVAYADPVVFGAAVAMRTKRVKIGFAVVEMALHHPGPAGGADGAAGQPEPRTAHHGHGPGFGL